MTGTYVSSGSGSSKPTVESMYHMWLGPNGLPVSPRKQRALLFQFCTTNFVTEAEMRYCYARLLSVGNPSGPVKFSGQPQYDSEQVVSPLFTFSAPPMSGDEGEEGGEEATEAQVQGGTTLTAQNQAYLMQPQPQQLHMRPQAPPRGVQSQRPQYVQQPQYLQQQQQQLEAKPRLPAPTSIIQPEPQGGARIITPVKLAGAAKANPQSEWAAFEAVQKASKDQWLAAQKKAQVHAAASAKMARGLLPRLNGLPKMTANAHGSSQLALSGPWYQKEGALAI